MGQLLHRIAEDNSNNKFPDLSKLPPELAVCVLSNLNSTDLCLAGCVWQHLANDRQLWKNVCRTEFGYNREHNQEFNYKHLYMKLDEGTLLFNANPETGLKQLKDLGILQNLNDIAYFLHTNQRLNFMSKHKYLKNHQDVLSILILLENFENQFLPNALRKFFLKHQPPNERGDYLHTLISVFSQHFCTCNPMLNLNADAVYVICFSLILLSVDLASPHVKNKMSKREFIKNTKNAARNIDVEFCGHLYDNIYLIGHVAPNNHY